ncbi:MAG: terminase large subunit, partial [bacterium]|nr:terminase large subunit [bacterium]
MISLATTDPVDLLAALLLEDGTPWGAVAQPIQRADAAAILDPHGPRQHYLTRPRGGSKSTDAAAVLLVVLLTQAPPESVSHLYAADAEQAALILSKVRGLAERTGLGGLLHFRAREVTVKESAARLRVEPADAPSAYGHTPYFVILDEAAAWPDTENYRTLRRAIFSGLTNRPDSRLVVLTSA